MSEANASYLEWNEKCFITKLLHLKRLVRIGWSTPVGVWSILRHCRKIWSTADAVWSKAFSGFMFFCLEIKAKKMADPPSLKLWRDKERGIRHEGLARSEREHRRPSVEKRRATHKKITLSEPCRKPQRKNEKLNSKFTCDLEFYYFYSDFLSTAWKRAKKNGGERGIRTLERENPLTIFETVAFGHSAISPLEPAWQGLSHFINIAHIWAFGNPCRRFFSDFYLNGGHCARKFFISWNNPGVLWKISPCPASE